MFISSKKNTSFGLDLGARWVKLVGLKKKGKKVVLDRVGRGLFSEEQRGPDEFVKHLEAFFKSLGIKKKEVVNTSFSGQSVIVKRVVFKAKDEDELEKVVFKEAKQYIPFDINDVVLDYQIMKSKKQEKGFEVYLVACKKQLVENLNELFKRAQIKIDVIDLDAFALANVFEFNYPEEMDKSSFLFDIGEKQSIFAVFSEGELSIFREMPFGGANLTLRIAEGLNLSLEEAERIKLEGATNLEAAQKTLVSKVIQEEIENWVGEVRKVINFYATTYPKAQEIKKVFLSGGSAHILSLEESLSREFSLNVDYLDPWRKIEKSAKSFDLKYLDEIKRQMVVATGLALRGVF